MKAVLVFFQQDFPLSHDLDMLRNLLPPGCSLREELPDLADLTVWAIEARYPGDWPEATAKDARLAVRRARKVWHQACAALQEYGFDVGEDDC